MDITFFSNDPQVVTVTEEFLISRYGKNLNSEYLEEIKLISARWKYALETKGAPDGQYIGKYGKYSFFSIKVKRSKVLIRFPFYRDLTNDRLVVLLGYYKIRPYSGGGKTDKQVQKEYERAQLYYDQYREDNNRFKIPKIIKDIMIN